MTRINPAHLNSIIHTHYLALKDKIILPQSSPYDIQTILTAPPKKLKEIAKWFESLPFEEQKEYDSIKYAYDNFTTKKQEYDAYDLADTLGIDTCPYCNINPTYTILDDTEHTLRPEFDHFYDKSTYPILALSFYNLIPSCHTCNATLKGNKSISFHPYEDDFDKVARFQLKLLDVSFYHSINGFEIELISEDPKAKELIELFKLNKRYKEHKDIILELIQKQTVYNESYIDELYKQYEGTFFNNREDIIRHISCGYVTSHEIHKRPLSKLIKDISEELGLT